MSHPGAIQTRSMMKSDRTLSVLKETSVEDDISEHTTSTSMKSGDPMEALQQAMISMMQSMEYDRMTRREAEVARQKQEEAWLKVNQDKVTAEIEKNKKWEAEAARRNREEESRRAADIVAKELEMKRQAILHNLQKLDNQTDPETYLAHFELSMAEGLIPTREWNQLLRKQTAGRAAEVFQELDGTMPYPEFKALMLERLGCTCVKARQTVWKALMLERLGCTCVKARQTVWRKSSRSIPGTGWNDGLCRIQSSNVGEESAIGPPIPESTSHSNH